MTAVGGVQAIWSEASYRATATYMRTVLPALRAGVRALARRSRSGGLMEITLYNLAQDVIYKRDRSVAD